jgi:hypothetical protein
VTHLGPEAADPLPHAERVWLNGYDRPDDDKDDGLCVVPVPHDAAPLPAFMMELKGRKADHRYDYFDAQHRLLGFVLRWEGRDVERKQFLPFTYWRNRFGGGAWRCKTWPRGKRPLYGEDKLGAHPHAMVALLEGEKTADAMHCGPLADAFKRCSEGVIAVTWPGGGNALEAVDLSPLADRDVIILPDDDEAGEQTADALVEILRKVGVRRVRRWKAPPDARLIKPSGWDIADALPPGCRCAGSEVQSGSSCRRLADARPTETGLHPRKLVDHD